MAENDVPGGSPDAGAAPDDVPQSAWVVLFVLLGAGLNAWNWASACTPKPIGEFLEVQAKAIGGVLFIFAFPSLLAKGRPIRALREALFFGPIYLVGLVPSVVSMTAGWEGGWSLGFAGAAVGAVAGAAAGWLFARWTAPVTEDRQFQQRGRRALPYAFAVLFALLAVYNWGIEWVPLDQVWWIGIAWLFLAMPGALVGRPLVGLLVASPFVLLILVPVIGSLTVGWEGGWPLGIAGAAVGAATGAVNGWLFLRWIMPEYDKRRARPSAARPPGANPVAPA